MEFSDGSISLDDYISTNNMVNLHLHVLDAHLNRFDGCILSMFQSFLISSFSGITKFHGALFCFSILVVHCIHILINYLICF